MWVGVGGQLAPALYVGLHAVGRVAGSDFHCELGGGSALWTESGINLIAKHGVGVHGEEGGGERDGAVGQVVE